MAAGDGGCGSVLCAVERRLIRKDLLSWTKKVPLLVGLETIAEALAGRGSVLSQRNASGPVGSLDVVPEDWNASQPCSVCLRNSSESEGLSDHRSWCGPHRNGALDVFSTEHRDLCDAYNGSHGYDLELDAPLDLRRHPPLVAVERSADVDCILGKSVTELKVPRIVQKATKQPAQQPVYAALKKTYTDVELAAATSDIRSGRIGTRRASTLYGIPRSTLRNKIFRLRTSPSSDVSSSSSSLSFADDFRRGGPVSGSAGRRPEAAFQRINDIKTECCSLMDFEQDAAMDTLYDARAAAAAAAAALGHYEGPYKTLVPPLPPPPQPKVVQGYFLEREGEAVETVMTKEWKGPFIERLIREFTEKQTTIDFDGFSKIPPLRTSDGFYAAPELKVPFYRSTDDGSDGPGPSPPPPPPPGFCSGDWRWAGGGGCSELLTSMSHSNRINEMLKEIITRTIAEKLRSHRFDALFGPAGTDGAVIGFTDVGVEEGATHRVVPPPTSSPEDFETSRADSRSTSGGSSSDGERRPRPGEEEEEEEKVPTKKTRPKRGQYRKYNRQLLLEAVKAVQKGDMSVHRAGSYYGVPHSTLEYKVKERHLLRQKKALENNAAARASEPSPLARSQSEADGCAGVPLGVAASSSSISRQHPKAAAAALLFGGKKGPPPPSKETGLRPTMIPPYSFRYSPIEDGLASPGLPLPVSCFRGTLPIGFGWPPPPPSALMAGLFSPPPVPPPSRPLFDAIQGPSTNFGGFSMSASDLLKRLQQKVQASLSSGGGGHHEVHREKEGDEDEEGESVLDPPPRRMTAALTPDLNNSGRSSAASCSTGSPQVAVS